MWQLLGVNGAWGQGRQAEVMVSVAPDRILCMARKAVSYLQLVILGCIQSNARSHLWLWLGDFADRINCPIMGWLHHEAATHMQPCISLQAAKVEQTKDNIC